MQNFDLVTPNEHLHYNEVRLFSSPSFFDDRVDRLDDAKHHQSNQRLVGHLSTRSKELADGKLSRTEFGRDERTNVATVGTYLRFEQSLSITFRHSLQSHWQIRCSPLLSGSFVRLFSPNVDRSVRCF